MPHRLSVRGEQAVTGASRSPATSNPIGYQEPIARHNRPFANGDFLNWSRGIKMPNWSSKNRVLASCAKDLSTHAPGKCHVTSAPLLCLPAITCRRRLLLFGASDFRRSDRTGCVRHPRSLRATLLRRPAHPRCRCADGRERTNTAGLSGAARDSAMRRGWR